MWTLRDKGALNVGISLENSWIKSKARYAVTLRLLHILLNVVVPLYKSPTFTTLNHINLLGISGSLALGLLFTLWAPPPPTTPNHNRCAGLNPRNSSILIRLVIYILYNTNMFVAQSALGNHWYAHCLTIIFKHFFCSDCRCRIQ